MNHMIAYRGTHLSLLLSFYVIIMLYITNIYIYIDNDNDSVHFKQYYMCSLAWRGDCYQSRNVIESK